MVGTVFLQCAYRHRTDGPEVMRPVGETEVVAAAATLSETGAYGRAKACAGIVAHADLRSAEINAVLDAHIAAGLGHSAHPPFSGA